MEVNESKIKKIAFNLHREALYLKTKIHKLIKLQKRQISIHQNHDCHYDANEK